MRLNVFNLNLLIHLDALLEEKSVSKAAARVCISQSAMSLALAHLREHFQDDILRQVGKKMVPTPVALSLVRPVRDILTQVRSINSSAMSFDPAKSDRRFTITGSDFTMDVVLKKLLPRLALIAPGVRISYSGLSNFRKEDFEQGRIDFLITPEISTLAGHRSELLLTADLTCAVWSGNTLVRDRISFDQYKQLGHVCVKLGDWRVPTYEEWFMKRYGDVRRIEVEVPSFGLAVQLVTGTPRITLCHLQQAKIYAKQYSLKLIPPPFDIPPSRLVLQWHEYMEHDPALTWFRTLLKEIVAQI